MDEEPREYPKSLSAVIVIGVVFLSTLVILLACVAYLIFASGSYFNVEIKPYEIGVQTQGRRVKVVVGPGTYSDIGWGVGIEHVSCEAIPFAVEDPEVITKDRQRIAITIGGDVLRSCDKEFIEETWRQFQKIYLEDDVVLHRMGQIAIQAVKSCVGDYDADAILEGSNTDIESCIDENLNWLAEAYGLRVENVSIREVALTSEPDTSK